MSRAQQNFLQDCGDREAFLKGKYSMPYLAAKERWNIVETYRNCEV
jgi:hypothetical protein